MGEATARLVDAISSVAPSPPGVRSFFPNTSPPGEGVGGATATTKAHPKIVSESGIFTREDMLRLGALGVDAVLIGEALMREDDIEAKLRELIG